MVEQVLVDLHQLLVVVAGDGVGHQRRIVRGDRLGLLVVAALDDLLDRRVDVLFLRGHDVCER